MENKFNSTTDNNEKQILDNIKLLQNIEEIDDFIINNIKDILLIENSEIFNSFYSFFVDKSSDNIDALKTRLEFIALEKGILLKDKKLENVKNEISQVISQVSNKSFDLLTFDDLSEDENKLVNLKINGKLKIVQLKEFSAIILKTKDLDLILKLYLMDSPYIIQTFKNSKTLNDEYKIELINYFYSYLYRFSNANIILNDSLVGEKINNAVNTLNYSINNVKSYLKNEIILHLNEYVFLKTLTKDLKNNDTNSELKNTLSNLNIIRGKSNIKKQRLRKINLDNLNTKKELDEYIIKYRTSLYNKKIPDLVFLLLKYINLGEEVFLSSFKCINILRSTILYKDLNYNFGKLDEKLINLNNGPLQSLVKDKTIKSTKLIKRKEKDETIKSTRGRKAVSLDSLETLIDLNKHYYKNKTNFYNKDIDYLLEYLSKYKSFLGTNNNTKEILFIKNMILKKDNSFKFTEDKINELEDESNEIENKQLIKVGENLAKETKFDNLESFDLFINSILEFDGINGIKEISLKLLDLVKNHKLELDFIRKIDKQNEKFFINLNNISLYILNLLPDFFLQNLLRKYPEHGSVSIYKKIISECKTRDLKFPKDLLDSIQIKVLDNNSFNIDSISHFLVSDLRENKVVEIVKEVEQKTTEIITINIFDNQIKQIFENIENIETLLALKKYFSSIEIYSKEVLEKYIDKLADFGDFNEIKKTKTFFDNKISKDIYEKGLIKSLLNSKASQEKLDFLLTNTIN